ncbi:fras1 related extracellular matrix protein [Plakobranchus ocellatus]|uniref:Fras1 related extracellular matrix protein n=1 Tax=Plakobranchus ocellatus TaxID=259542 RepID=A0AAV4BW20_9GAST|nr:fras1 related extracellular matrix protein [Plakobranchus ocellatus]
MFFDGRRSVAASTVSVSIESLNQYNLSSYVGSNLPHERYLEGQTELDQQDDTSCANLVTPKPPVALSDDFWNVDVLSLTLEVQGRAGLRLSHFLSNFLQNNDYSDNARNVQIMNEAYRRWRPGQESPTFDSPMIEVYIDRDLTYKQLASEAYATLMSEDGISSVGIFLDRGFHINSSEPVSAFAWRGDSNDNEPVGNVVNPFEEADDFTAKGWFNEAREAYSQITLANTRSFVTDREVRVTRTGTPKPVPLPVTYTATLYDQGIWLPPHFQCGPRQAGWIASYVSPILVLGPGAGGITFGGVVKVDAVFTANNISPN